jgi:two-component system, LytTR family, response regulator
MRMREHSARDAAADAEPVPIIVLIVDDERPARRKLRRLLDGVPGITKIFEAPSGRLALDVIEEAEPDVVFLDVRMPGMDGFQFLDALGPRGDIEIVFVTAYDEHAVRAFDVRAIDYLLKPFDEPRFRTAIERARAAVAARRSATERRDVAHVIAAFRHALTADAPARLLVESSPGRKHLLPVERVLRIEADRNDAILHADGRTYRQRTTLAELETKLDPDRFLRINRSEIVNVDCIIEVEPLDHGDARIHLSSAEVRRMSRRYRERMKRFE